MPKRMHRYTNVTLTNRIAYLDISRSQHHKLDALLRFHPKNYQYTPAYKYYAKNRCKIREVNRHGRKRLYCERHDEYTDNKNFCHEYDGGGWDGYIRLLSEKDHTCPAGLFRAIKDELEKKTHIKFNVKKDLAPVFFKRHGLESEKDSKWKFQNDCLWEMVNNAEQGGGLILNATGTGKTRIAGLFFSWLSGNGVFIVDELTLLKQARESLEKTLGEKVGIVGNSKFRPERITVATIQTMHKYRTNRKFKKWTRTLEVMIIDEIHVQMNRRNFQTTAEINPPCIFGLTATLALRKKHVRMKAYSLCGPVLFEYPLTQGQKDDVLDYGVVLQVNHNHLSKKRRGRKGYIWDYTRLIVECDERNDIVEALVKEGIKRRKRIVVLVERINHIKEMIHRFRKIPHKLAYGAIFARDRLAAAKGMNDGKVRLIIANKVFTKGIDISRLNVIIDAAAKVSHEDAIQKFGRGVRKHDKKKGLIYFDIGDENNRFERASGKRRKAFKHVKIPLIQIPYKYTLKHRWAKRLYRKAEAHLREIKK